MNLNKLSIVSKMDKSRLVSDNYFQTYIEEAKRVGLLSREEVAQIQLELVKLLEIQIQRYTRFESSSVKVETAQGLMRSILYALDFKFKTLKEEEGVELLKTEPIETLFREGISLIKQQAEKCRWYFEKITQTRLAVSNYAYNDTIDYGFKPFFSYYEAEFSGHVSGVDIDYPLCMDEMKEEGVVYVYHYLKKLYYENLFCRHFKAEDIQKLLESSYPNQTELLVNIFEMVLINSLGRVLVHKDLKCLSLSRADCSALQSLFENHKNSLKLLQMAASKVNAEFEVDDFLKQYIGAALGPISIRVEHAAANKTMEHIFIPFEEEKTFEAIQFKDGESMEDEAFKKMIEEVCSKKEVSDKIAVFKQYVHSLKDLIDFLEAECLYGKEYKALYGTLSEMELALLLKSMSVQDEEDFRNLLKEVRLKKLLLHPWESELLEFVAEKKLIGQKLWQIVQHIKMEMKN